MSAATIIAATLLAAAGTAMVVIAVACGGDQPDEPAPAPHEGWEQGHEDELHDLAAGAAIGAEEWADTYLVHPYVSRHHEDTVDIVPGDYTPSVGRRRIAAITDTQQIEAGDA